MTEEQRKRIDAIIRFRDDLQRFSHMVLEPERPAGYREFRQSLLQRAGGIRAVCDRVIGSYAKPQGSLFGPIGPAVDLWDLALTPSGHFDTPRQQAHYAEAVGDLLTQLIGRLEAEPVLLDPPAPRPSGAQAPGSAQTINVHGGTVNIAQTHSGNITQTTQVTQDITDVKQLLRARPATA